VGKTDFLTDVQILPFQLQEHAMDLQALDAFSGKRRTEGLRPLERPEPWSLRRTGPGLGGRIYIGIRRRF